MRGVQVSIRTVMVCIFVFCVGICYAESYVSVENACCENPCVDSCGEFPKNVAKKILVVHSYHADYEWVVTVSRGIKSAFQREKNIWYEVMYMDTNRHNSEEYKCKAGEDVRKAINHWQPDVLLLVDDNAQEYVGKYYAEKGSPMIVFCGVNAEPTQYGYDGAKNVTGILERPHFVETVRLFQQTRPAAKHIAVISDDSSTSRATLDYIDGAAKNSDIKIVASDTPRTFGEWQQRISEYQTSADVIVIYTYHTVKSDDFNEHVLPEAVLRWTINNSDVPVIALLDFAVDQGALCGIVESGMQQGYEAGMMAKSILRGESIADFPVKISKKGTGMFNELSAERWNIPLTEQAKRLVHIFV